MLSPIKQIILLDKNLEKELAVKLAVQASVNAVFTYMDAYPAFSPIFTTLLDSWVIDNLSEVVVIHTEIEYLNEISELLSDSDITIQLDKGCLPIPFWVEYCPPDFSSIGAIAIGPLPIADIRKSILSNNLAEELVQLFEYS